MSSLAHGDTYGDEKLYFYSSCFVSITVYCCITVKLLVNAVEKRIGGSCCLTSFFWWFQMWCEIEWGMLLKDSWPIHTGLPVVSNLSKRRIETSHQENIWFYWERYLQNPKETLCVCLVAQSYMTLCDPMGSRQAPLSIGFYNKNTRVSYQFLLQGFFLTQDQTHISYIAGGFFTTEPPGKPKENLGSRKKT